MHLNCAVDAHGHLAGPGGEPVLLSTEADMRRVHRLRAEVDAILVGVQTVINDDPGLRVNAVYATGPDPIPVVLDSRLRIPPSSRVASRKETLIYHTGDVTLNAPAKCYRVPAAKGGVDLEAVLRHMAGMGIKSVLVEGGARVLQSFVASGLWTTWTVFQANMDTGGGPKLWGGLPDAPQPGMKLVARKETMGGILWTFAPSRE